MENHVYLPDDSGFGCTKHFVAINAVSGLYHELRGSGQLTELYNVVFNLYLQKSLHE